MVRLVLTSHTAFRCASFVLLLLLLQSDISHKIVHSHGYYHFEVQSGSKNFSLGFPEKNDAETWFGVLHEAAGGERYNSV